MNWTVIVAEAAQKQLARFPAKDQSKIAAVLLAMANSPFSGDIIKLEGEQNRWRRASVTIAYSFRLTKLPNLSL